ncbi:Flagellar basal body rod protein FlgF [Alloalcanivorax dieselolei B5]|uniref:Flagellar basal-body rod protein FlgF n=1 Tax=Alcanivorax dieselolei (strain DSM 16502 / CGMCC 1.3690 / MCCC 1A00001 / B-5) TaxID=930169 RepID=K0CDL8_ALCDB|nr:flagellar basal body rod protein FlgF [Alloalcanivorax dieselolei]AFT71699.1 Flagellar basal body rod protein FlgF [Alloalcanivorax dieselolei B5]GGJ88683.1 flagellar basal body protein [Alloalcanivorax dieselolei]
MDRILYTAMVAAKQSQDQQAVVSNNLANATTSGFREQIHALRAVPVQGDGALPTRVSMMATTPGTDFSIGPINATGRDLDVALQEGNWLAVQGADGAEAYTRRGDLQVNGEGLLTSGGRPVIGDGGPIVVPLGASLSIGADGTVSAIGAGEQPDAIAEVGRLKLVNDAAGNLERGDDGLFRAGAGALPRDELGRLQSGALEGSNVSTMEAMVSMINTARRYEMQLQVIEHTDQNSQRANALLSMNG